MRSRRCIATSRRTSSASGAPLKRSSAPTARRASDERLQLECQGLDGRRVDARSTQRADECTDRGADDQIRRQAHLVQRVQHADMGESARAAGAEHPGHARRARQRRHARCVFAVVVGVGREGAGCYRRDRGQGSSAERGADRSAEDAPPHAVKRISAAVGPPGHRSNRSRPTPRRVVPRPHRVQASRAGATRRRSAGAGLARHARRGAGWRSGGCRAI